MQLLRLLSWLAARANWMLQLLLYTQPLQALPARILAHKAMIRVFPRSRPTILPAIPPAPMRHRRRCQRCQASMPIPRSSSSRLGQNCTAMNIVQSCTASKPSGRSFKARIRTISSNSLRAVCHQWCRRSLRVDQTAGASRSTRPPGHNMDSLCSKLPSYRDSNGLHRHDLSITRYLGVGMQDIKGKTDWHGTV